MKLFELHAPQTVQEACEMKASLPDAVFIAGGTNLVDLMKMEFATPHHLIDLSRLPLRQIEDRGDHLRLGALATNTEAADHPAVRRDAKLLSLALLAGATQQLRNAATVAGNLLQRVRCPYFYDAASPCNKRVPQAGCSARGGHDRMNALFGTSAACTAAHPSDFAVALVALSATVNVAGPRGPRTIAIEALHREPGDTPHVDTTLGPDELITSVDVKKHSAGRHMAYHKIRDRRSYAFALVSGAAAVDLREGMIREVRLACGGVGTRPWRFAAIEAELRGRPATPQTYRAALRQLGDGAQPGRFNAFKIDLAQRALERAMIDAVAA